MAEACNRFIIPNYVSHRSDRLVRHSIRDLRIGLPDLVSLEVAAIQTSTRGVGPLRLFSVYTYLSRTFVVRDYEEILESDTPTLIAGDFSAKHLF